MHELPSPLSSQIPAGLEAALAANALHDEKMLLGSGYYDQLHTRDEIIAATVANETAFNALVTAAGGLIGKKSLLAAEDSQTQRLFLAGNERLRMPGVVLRSEVAHDAAQSDETLLQTAKNRAAIREGISEAFQPYVQAFLDKMPQPMAKRSRIARSRSHNWEVPDEQGGHRFTMHYREDSQGVHLTRVDCITLPPADAVKSYNNLSARYTSQKVSGAALFPPCIVSCQFEKGEPVELSLNWPPQMFSSTYLQSLGRIGNLVGRRYGNSELCRPSAVLRDIGRVAEDAGTGRTQITFNLREEDPTIALKKTPTEALTQSLLTKVLIGTPKDTEIGGYAYNPQNNCFEALGMPYPAVSGGRFAALVSDILRYIPTLQEE